MPPKKSTMSASHKEALALGRRQSAIVREYLEALEETKPRRGRRRTEASIKKRLDAIEKALPVATAIQRLNMLQERRDLEAELADFEEPLDVDSIEKDFVKVAKAYSDSKGIRYSTWREMGVPGEVLQKAGIARTRG